MKLPRGRRVRIWFIDEHRYGLISHQRRCWAMRRLQPHAPYRTRYEWGYVASALEVAGQEEALCVFLPVVSQESSAAFLEQIAARDPEAVHVVIQDQAGFHLQEGEARLPENIRLLPLPPYCLLVFYDVRQAVSASLRLSGTEPDGAGGRSHQRRDGQPGVWLAGSVGSGH